MLLKNIQLFKESLLKIQKMCLNDKSNLFNDELGISVLNSDHRSFSSCWVTYFVMFSVKFAV